MWRAPARAGVALALLCLASGVSAAELEDQVKAEFLERLTRFIDWPSSAFPDADAPFVIGIAGKHPVGALLEEMVRDRKAKGRTIALRSISKPEDVEGCHLVFIAPSENKRLADLLARTSGKPILTVGDTPGFAERGVLVNFYIGEKYVRFEINEGEVKRSGLKFSAKLMKLGRLVRPKGRR